MIDKLKQYINGEVPPHFVDNPGTEAYSYYMKMAQSLPSGSLISDLGTYQGLSALALSVNPKNKVESYDVDLSNNLVKKDNIKFIETNCFDKINRILKSDLILIDLDPHDGIQELRFYELLIEKKYKGITIWDDIKLNLSMKNFWTKCYNEKEDVSNQGHHSGTGLIIFK